MGIETLRDSETIDEWASGGEGDGMNGCTGKRIDVLDGGRQMHGLNSTYRLDETG